MLQHRYYSSVDLTHIKPLDHTVWPHECLPHALHLAHQSDLPLPSGQNRISSMIKSVSSYRLPHLSSNSLVATSSLEIEGIEYVLNNASSNALRHRKGNS